jgi:hypothetical protein
MDTVLSKFGLSEAGLDPILKATDAVIAGSAPLAAVTGNLFLNPLTWTYGYIVHGATTVNI